jgi:putative transposase
MGEEDLPMSWNDTCPMNERLIFVAEIQRSERSMTQLCEDFGISRKTGYKWWRRYEAAGVDGLKERLRAPLSHPNAVKAGVVGLLLQARQQHPSWGPEKLLHWLAPRHPHVCWPALSTVGAILARHGLVKPRRRVRRSPPYAEPRVEVGAPNAVWSADFKGQFRTGDGRYCYPLTVLDGFSRYLLLCRGLLTTVTEEVRPWFVRAFRLYGLPLAIRTDNGPPFASVALGGLSALSLWWVKLGILPERICPGHPEQNGRHERMHLTLKQHSTRPVRASLRAQQHAFDRFLAEYNHERPHQALGHRTPEEIYCPSARPYPERLPEVEYPAGVPVRRVRQNGQIKWQGRLVYASEVLAGEPLGLKHVDEDAWHVYFGPLLIGRLERNAERIHSLK